MRNKINYLFAESQIRKRRTADENEILQANREVLEAASQVFRNALDKLLEEKSKARPMYRDKNWAAVTMNGYVCGMMRELFPKRMKCNGGNWEYHGHSAIFKFKLLNNKLLPNNLKTEKVKRERNQLNLLNEPPLPIIYVGYRMNSNFTNIIGSYAVCIEQWKVIKWLIDLDDLAVNEVPLVAITKNQNESVNMRDSIPIVKLKGGKLRKANE